MNPTLTRKQKLPYNPFPLIEARKRRKMSQEDVAQAIGKSFVTICRIETGIAASYETVEELCRYYGIPKKLVIEEEEPANILA